MMKEHLSRFAKWSGWKKIFSFGTGESWEHLLNLAVGCVVCLLTVAMGIYMIRRTNREIKQLQEK